MSHKLEKFIQMHKKELSSLTPSESLWLSIGAGIPATTMIASKVSWLKIFGFSATTIAAATAVTFFITKNTEPVAPPTAMRNQPVVSEAKFIAEQPAENKTSVNAEKIVADSPKTKAVKPLVPSLPVAPALPLPQYAPAALVPATPALPAVPALPGTQAVPVTPLAPAVNAPQALKSGTQIQWKKNENGGLKADTSFAGVKKVELFVSTCDVNVVSNTDRNVSFKADVTTQTKGLVTGKIEYELKYDLKDSVLRISLTDSGKKVVVVGTFIEDAKIIMNIPANVSVSLNDAYGDISMTGLTGGKYKIDATSGDVITDNIHGEIDLRSGYGNVKMSNIKGPLHAEVTSGDTWITKLDGDAVLKSAYGNQTLKEITGKMQIRSSSGDIKIGNMKGDLDITSSYGSISLEGYEGSPSLVAVSGDITGKDVRLKNSMTAKSNYGNIKMALLNDSKELSFDLQSSYGKISVNKDGVNGNSEDHLQIKQGDILVTGVTTSGDQSYK
ncbi:MAG: DUF4097 family beta strand repeat-containing protein [Bacteroidia bacterium]